MSNEAKGENENNNARGEEQHSAMCICIQAPLSPVSVGADGG